MHGDDDEVKEPSGKADQLGGGGTNRATGSFMPTKRDVTGSVISIYRCKNTVVKQMRDVRA